MISRRLLCAMLAASVLLLSPASAQAPAEPLTIFAAASLKEALEAINLRWIASGKPAARLVFGASGSLARQIEQAAPADLFISADEVWMDYLSSRRNIRADQRRVITTNRLVVIAKVHSARLVTIESGLSANQLHIGSKLAIGDIRAVPAGAYAKAALEKLGLWEAMQPHLVMVENVRVALALVARGEVETGIVYASDAAAEPKVRIIGSFPGSLHPQIRYPAAPVSTSKNLDTPVFLEFLGSPEARIVFSRLGFVAKP